MDHAQHSQLVNFIWNIADDVLDVEREVWPRVPDAWVDATKTQIGYEISFTHYFY